MKPGAPELRREPERLRSEMTAELDRMRRSINCAMFTFNLNLALGLALVIVAIVLKG